MNTLDYYRHRASDYALSTQTVDMGALHARFLSQVPARGRLLDAGCGSGRDARAFRALGYDVEAFDACRELAEHATIYAGIPVKVLDFLSFTEEASYDGIWACASLLHLPECSQSNALARLWRSLKPDGVLYASYKLGIDERLDEHDRLFTDANENRLKRWLEPLAEVRSVQTWITSDRQSGRPQSWLNALVVRSPALR